MTTTLALPSAQRPAALRPGRLVKVWRGAQEVWAGTLAEPTANQGSGGWQITANGIGTDGNSFMAEFDPAVAWDDNLQLDKIIDRARGRGLRWTRRDDLTPAIVPGLDLTQHFDSASKSITDALNQFTAGGTLTWEIDRIRHELRIHPLPSAVTRLLFAPDPPGRTVSGHYDRLFVNYKTSVGADHPPHAVEDSRQIARYGALEAYGDYTAASPMTVNWPGNRAFAWGTGVLGKYRATSYTSQFAVVPGQVLTLGGAPVDLGTERAGEVYKVIGATQGWGGDDYERQIVFTGGGYSWDEFAEAAAITPYQTANTDLSSIMQAMAPTPAPLGAQAASITPPPYGIAAASLSGAAPDDAARPAPAPGGEMR